METLRALLILVAPLVFCVWVLTHKENVESQLQTKVVERPTVVARAQSARDQNKPNQNTKKKASAKVARPAKSKQNSRWASALNELEQVSQEMSEELKNPKAKNNDFLFEEFRPNEKLKVSAKANRATNDQVQVDEEFFKNIDKDLESE